MATAQNQTNAAFLNNLLATSIAGSTANQLQGYGNQAIGALGTGYGQARTDVTGQLQPSLDALGGGYQAGNAALGVGYNTATGAENQAIGAYQPYADTGASANTMYGNALGLNGAAGNTAATGAFQASPGYAWNRDQAIDAAARKAASLGVAGSGNTLSAITGLGENLANQEYGNWLTNLNNAAGRGLTAASGQAAGYNNLASLGTNYGTALNANAVGQGTNTANALTNYGATLGSLDTGLGTGQASVYGGLGNSLAGVNSSFLSALTQNNTNAAQAQDAANNANQNAALGVLGLGVRGLGTIAGLGTGGGSTIGGSLLSSAGSGIRGLFS